MDGFTTCWNSICLNYFPGGWLFHLIFILSYSWMMEFGWLIFRTDGCPPQKRWFLVQWMFLGNWTWDDESFSGWMDEFLNDGLVMDFCDNVVHWDLVVLGQHIPQFGWRRGDFNLHGFMWFGGDDEGLPVKMFWFFFWWWMWISLQDTPWALQLVVTYCFKHCD